MEKSVSSVKILNIVICLVLLVLFVLFSGTRKVDASINENLSDEYPSRSTFGYLVNNLNEDKIIEPTKEIIIYDVDYYIKRILKNRILYRNFDYNIEDVKKDLKNRNKDEEIFISTNIGNIKDKKGNQKIYNNFEYGLIEYFYDLNKKGTIKRNQKYKPYNGSAEYIEKLIMYYSTIYTNVEPNIMLSIGAAESGYYRVKYMLKYNNVYGGMSGKGLIKHNNIELGVLSYIRMMSRNYYGKGLTTLSSIGRVYCPVMENGVKKASSHWINLVNTANQKYKDYNTNITFTDIYNKNEII